MEGRTGGRRKGAILRKKGKRDGKNGKMGEKESKRVKIKMLQILLCFHVDTI